ncbi:MAG: phosphoribosylanthranilate isomerase [Victivallales bacterium]|nr:phosphoribosylanthranilate isomerase [Victivallales bacterium]
MRVKICGIRNDADAKTAVTAGAHAIGMMVGQRYKSAEFILPSTACRIAAGLPPFVTPVIVTQLDEVEEILAIIRKSEIVSIQLHGALAPEQVRAIRGFLPTGGMIIMAAYITRGVCPDLSEYYPYIDAIQADACNGATARIETEEHREFYWQDTAEFVARCPLPVILSGGLTPENVAEAARNVNPYCVDVTRGVKDPDGESCCWSRCRAFLNAAAGIGAG